MLRHKILTLTLAISLILGGSAWYLSARFSAQMLANYYGLESAVVKDREQKIISLKPNSRGYYAPYLKTVPERFGRLLLASEDKHFYRHPGFNPASIARSLYRQLAGNGNSASSTITQQAVKILRQAEFDRSLRNKLVELVYAVSLELHASKKDILRMYVNLAYFGNETQGLESASQLYFNTQPATLTDEQIIKLLAALPSPTLTNPFTPQNSPAAAQLAARLKLPFAPAAAPGLRTIEKQKAEFKAATQSPANFEIASVAPDCPELTIDRDLTASIRESLNRQVEALAGRNVTNGAVVVLSLPKNELIALVGSPNPGANIGTSQINMAIKPRPIGSTIKPLIYLQGFQKGLRPYTLVDDKEYRYVIGSGFAFYPKNYDYQYHGRVSLHYALANSLNVPTVKVLEYVGINNFDNFLINDLAFRPIQPINNYQLGIALGGLEMDLLTLSYYFSLLPAEGRLNPLVVCRPGGTALTAGQTDFNQKKNIAPRPLVQLVNKILTDRQTGVDQFGSKNNLTIPGLTIAAKTGTSREYHDSWIVGFTPDWLVGVWLGNADNTALDKVSGESGAGRLWREVAEKMRYSPYNTGRSFQFNGIHEFTSAGGIQYGLANDNFADLENRLLDNDLILNPHRGDEFLLQANTKIPLRASASVNWSVNGQSLGAGAEYIFQPRQIGDYQITATGQDGQTATVSIRVNAE